MTFIVLILAAAALGSFTGKYI